MLSRNYDMQSVVPSELESETRVIVMDFMGLVPLSCPPTSAFFKPFDDPREKNNDEFRFDNDSFNNNLKNRRSVPVYRTPRNQNSGRFSLAAPVARCFKRENSFRTIIRKRDKLVVLEETAEDVNGESCIVFLPAVSKTNGIQSSNESNGHTKNGKKRVNLSLNVDVSRDYKPRPVGELAVQHQAAISSFYGNNFDPQDVQILRRNIDSTDGSSVDNRKSSMSSSPKNTTGTLVLNSKDNHYVDISKIGSLERLVDKGELSPVAVPLQNELKGLRLSIMESVGRESIITSTQSPMSPSAEVADTLRAIADQVQEEFADELNGAVGKLVSFEESKRLTFEVLKEVAMELTKDIAPGWARVVMPLVLGQAATMALLLLGNRSVVGKLVDYTTRFLCDNIDDNFFASSGGWDGVRNSGFREFPMSVEEFQTDDSD